MGIRHRVVTLTQRLRRLERRSHALVPQAAARSRAAMLQRLHALTKEQLRALLDLYQRGGMDEVATTLAELGVTG